MDYSVMGVMGSIGIVVCMFSGLALSFFLIHFLVTFFDIAKRIERIEKKICDEGNDE